MKNCLVKEAEQIAREAHVDQKRWGSGDPYITHPERIATKFTDDIRKSISWLHDVREDNPSYTADVIARRLTEAGAPEDDVCIIMAALDVLTRREEETYTDYIQRVMTNSYAVDIKLEDLNDNLRFLKPGSLQDKYLLAQILLKQTQAREQIQIIIERCVNNIFSLCGIKVGHGPITIKVLDQASQEVRNALGDFIELLAAGTPDAEYWRRVAQSVKFDE